MKLSKGEILTLERQIDFPAIVESKEKSVLSLRQDNYDTLVKFVLVATSNYLELCYPNQTNLSDTIVNDLIETRPTWVAADFVNLFKFFRQRQDIEGLRIMGNQITLPKFMEMVSVYEEHRAKAKEEIELKKKSEHNTAAERSYSDQSLKAIMGRQLDHVQAQGKDRLVRGDSGQGYFEKIHK